MNVLLISTKKTKPVGGIAVWTNHYLSKCHQHNIDAFLVNTEKETDKTFGGLSEISRTKRIFSDLTDMLRTHRFDVAHLNTSCGPFGLFRDFLIAQKIHKKGIPIVTHYHCDIPHWIRTPFSRYTIKKLAKLSYHNFVLCESSRIYLNQFGVDAIKVPNFIQDDAIAIQPKEIRSAYNRFFFVGRVSRPKGSEELFELAKRFPKKTFALAGAIVPPVKPDQAPSNVRFLGLITSSRIKELLDRTDLFLFPSHSEGFSLALMEAMARGVPCVAFDSVGANSDMLADGCGVTVPFMDVEAMEVAIRRLEDPALRKDISEKAIAKVRDEYTTDAVLSLFKKVYENKL